MKRETWRPLRGTRTDETPDSTDERYGLARPTRGGDLQWTGRVALVEDDVMLPLSWESKRAVDVVCDLFHPNVTDPVRDRLFAVMALAHHHTFRLATRYEPLHRAYFTVDPHALMGQCAEARVGTQAMVIARKRGENVDHVWWDAFWSWPLVNVSVDAKVAA
jgi:hypothetical protein